jgi:hypothetical protein
VYRIPSLSENIRSLFALCIPGKGVAVARDRHDKLFATAAALVLFFSYWLLFGVYRPAEIDDAWTASYVWNLTHNHSTADTVFGAPSNIRYFGHIHAYLAGFYIYRFFHPEPLGEIFSYLMPIFQHGRIMPYDLRHIAVRRALLEKPQC